MITIIARNMEYKGLDGFEEIRDATFVDDFINIGCIAANYSPKHKIGIFTFIDVNSIPEVLKRYAKHYHPVTSHTHEDKHADGGY